MIGTWNKNINAVEIEVDALAIWRPLLVIMFSSSWYKKFDLFVVDDNNTESEHHVMHWNNTDPNHLHFTYKLEPGRTYRIRPGCNPPAPGAPNPPSEPSQNFQGNDATGQTRMEMFEWDYGQVQVQRPTAEKASITLILIDNTVGPEVPGDHRMPPAGSIWPPAMEAGGTPPAPNAVTVTTYGS